MSNIKKTLNKYKPLIIILLIVLIFRAYSWFDKNNELREMKQVITKDLKDPASAIFRNITSDNYQVCGEVNAKNSYGAYIGYKRFTYSKLTKSASLEPADSILSSADSKMLKKMFDIAWETCPK